MSIEMKFGSNARGDYDNISDIDILKVYDLKYESENDNTNTHVYTKNRLYKLKKAKSLFLVHLKKEGEIISDEDNWLFYFLNNIPNFKSSNNSIKKVKKYIELLLCINPSEKQILWWFDSLYVFLRDYFIKTNSRFEYYSFSPNSFASFLTKYNKLDLTEDILILRNYKSKYRNQKEIDFNIDLKYIKSLKERICFSLDIIINEKLLLDILLSKKKEFEPYFILKIIEGLYLDKKVSIDNEILLKFFEEPHKYTWEIKNIDFLSSIKI